VRDSIPLPADPPPDTGAISEIAAENGLAGAAVDTPAREARRDGQAWRFQFLMS